MNIKQPILLALMIAALTACGSDSKDPAPTSPDAPVLSAIGDITVLQGTKLTLNITATDPNGDALVFSATATGAIDPLSLASPATFSTNPDQVSASFIWTPDTTVQTLGDYNMKFTVTDDSTKTLSDSETMTITVVDRVGQGRILYSDNCGDC
ncbi:MAG: Ig-like domain-containing protein, partial [Thiohalomonadales bacterium]